MPDQNSNTTASQGIFPRIDQLCQISLVLLLGTGLFTLVGTGKLDGFSIVAATSALVVRGAMLLRGNNWRVPARWTSLLGLLYFLVFFVDCFLISRNFVSASIHLVLFGMVIKLFSVERDRDLLYLAVLAFLEVLAAAVLTVETGFLTAFALFVVISIGTFIALEIRRSVVFSQQRESLQEQPQPVKNHGLFGAAAAPVRPAPNQRVLETPAADPHWRQLYRALAGITIAQALGIVLCGSLIFFALPRLSGGYLGELAQQTDLMTGFGERVQLGQIGRIQQSSQVVMHVRFEGTPPPEIRLRGITLANFDGRNWSSGQHAVPPVVPLPQAFFRAVKPSDVRSFATGRAARLVQYRVILEPLGTNIVFVIPTPRALFGNTRQVLENFDESIETLDPDRFLSSYSGISDVAQPSRAELREASGTVPREMPARYFQLPEELDARIPRLAAEVARGHATVFGKAEAIERYLTSNFAYTLELPRQPQRDPIAYFLFERKRGHCEYFASAMAIMLRELGIASRVVTGFRGGEFNQLTGSYIIRARDAHAWVEAYIPGKGWAAFDPTPMSGEATGRWNKLQLYLDAANEFWRDWVVNYDYSHQRILTASTITHSRRASEKAWALFTGIYPRLLAWARAVNRSVSLHPRRYQVLAVAILGLAMCIPLSLRIARWVRRSALMAQPGRDPKHAATLLYQQMARAAGGRGWRRKPSQTPSEFASAISHSELRAAVARFTLHYERARYAESAEDAALLPGLLQQVRHAAR
jgi:transglutaminase-like putative cysteine protease/uncharacterized membrane protein